VIGSSKVIKCEILNEENSKQNANSNGELTLHNLKPGFNVSSKITKLLENGVEVSFLGGFTGTIFVDHLDRSDVSMYKMGEKLIARIIVVDA